MNLNNLSTYVWNSGTKCCLPLYFFPNKVGAIWDHKSVYSKVYIFLQTRFHLNIIFSFRKEAQFWTTKKLKKVAEDKVRLHSLAGSIGNEENSQTLSLQLAFYVLFTAVNVPRKRTLGRAISKSTHGTLWTFPPFIVPLAYRERKEQEHSDENRQQRKGEHVMIDRCYMMMKRQEREREKNPKPGASYGKLDSY